MKKILLICLLILMGVLVTACGSNSAADAPVAVDAELAGEAPEAEAVETEAQDDAAASVAAEDETTDAEADAPEVVDACIECHTDQATLTNTAKPEEDHEAESEGEG